MVTISVKFKLELTKEQRRKVLDLAKKYRDAFNEVSEYAFNNRVFDHVSLHKAFYYKLKEKYGFQSQIAISVIREVAQHYDNIFNQLAGKIDVPKKNRRKLIELFYKEIGRPIKRKKLIVKLVKRRSYDLKLNPRVCSISVIGERLKKIPYYGWNKHYEYIEKYGYGDAVLYYERSNKLWYLIVSVEVPDKELRPKKVVGVDINEPSNSFVALHDSLGESHLVEFSQHVLKLKTHYHKLRSQLQSKGTRSAKRRLLSLSGVEKRLVRNYLHVVAKKIVVENSPCVFGLEDLTGIREYRENNAKFTGERRRQFSQWCFRELQQLIEYKAKLYGSKVVYVNPQYTSISCPVCGYTDKENRDGKEFNCKNCGFREHADVVGAKNIMLRVLKSLQNGAFVSRPDAPSHNGRSSKLRPSGRGS
jgi:putative transposase